MNQNQETTFLSERATFEEALRVRTEMEKKCARLVSRRWDDCDSTARVYLRAANGHRFFVDRKTLMRHSLLARSMFQAQHLRDVPGLASPNTHARIVAIFRFFLKHGPAGLRTGECRRTNKPITVTETKSLRTMACELGAPLVARWCEAHLLVLFRRSEGGVKSSRTERSHVSGVLRTRQSPILSSNTGSNVVCSPVQ
jgi:hypothetical protein